jgi:hypothetical protein
MRSGLYLELSTPSAHLHERELAPAAGSDQPFEREEAAPRHNGLCRKKRRICAPEVSRAITHR